MSIFVSLYPVEGQPAYEPWRLALVTVLQYAEGLTDRQAANAVRERIDWKYALGLELTDPGFDFSVLSKFRQRLVDRESETLLLDRLLEHVLTAVAINLVRIDAVLTHTPRGKTRRSHFTRLALHPHFQSQRAA